jgi:hypothetical protein
VRRPRLHSAPHASRRSATVVAAQVRAFHIAYRDRYGRISGRRRAPACRRPLPRRRIGMSTLRICNRECPGVTPTPRATARPAPRLRSRHWPGLHYDRMIGRYEKLEADQPMTPGTRSLLYGRASAITTLGGARRTCQDAPIFDVDHDSTRGSTRRRVSLLSHAGGTHRRTFDSVAGVLASCSRPPRPESKAALPFHRSTTRHSADRL